LIGLPRKAHAAFLGTRSQAGAPRLVIWNTPSIKKEGSEPSVLLGFFEFGIELDSATNASLSGFLETAAHGSPPGVCCTACTSPEFHFHHHAVQCRNFFAREKTLHSMTEPPKKVILILLFSGFADLPYSIFPTGGAGRIFNQKFSFLSG
jgi:hypothetical protein